MRFSIRADHIFIFSMKAILSITDMATIPKNKINIDNLFLVLALLAINKM